MESLASLALLACPIAMGAMMWFMMRGMGAPAKKSGDPGELAALRAEQRRLQGELDRLREGDGTTAVGTAVARG